MSKSTSSRRTMVRNNVSGVAETKALDERDLDIVYPEPTVEEVMEYDEWLRWWMGSPPKCDTER